MFGLARRKLKRALVFKYLKKCHVVEVKAEQMGGRFWLIVEVFTKLS